MDMRKALSPIVLIIASAIFLLDILTSKGLTIWLLYFLPLFLTFLSPKSRDPLYCAGLITILGIAGLELSPAGKDAPYHFVNRGLGLCVLWIVAILLTMMKRQSADLGEAHLARDMAQTEALISGQTLQGIVRSAMDAIITVDDDQNIVLFNPAAEQMFRTPVKEAIGSPLDRFIPPRFRDGHRKHVETYALSGGTSRRMGALGRVAGLRASGEEFPLEASISRFSTEAHQYLTVILRDITQQERDREQLHRAYRTLRMLSRVNQVLIRATEEEDFLRDVCRIVVDEGKYRLVWVGLIEDDQNRTIRPVVCLGLEADAQRITEVAATHTELGQVPAGISMRTGQPYIARNIDSDPAFALWREDAVKYGYRSSLTLPFPCHTRPIGVLQVFAEDANAFDENEIRLLRELADDAAYGIQQTRTKRILHKTHDLLTATIQASPAAMIVLDGEGRVQLWNQTAERIFGWLAEEVVGKPLPTIPREGEREHRTIREQVLQGNAFLDRQVIRQRKDGTLIDVSLSTAALRDIQGHITGVLGILTDITARKEMERRASRLEELATLGQLLSGIAHELKNPLFVLSGRLQLLSEKLSLGKFESMGPDLAKIENAANRMTTIIQRFLSIARPHVIVQEQCNANEALMLAQEFLSNELLKNRIAVETVLADNLPPIWCDKRELMNVFVNVIMNANYAMTKANGRGRLLLSTALRGSMIEIRIQDDGPGITPEHQTKLFDPFFTTKPPGEGTGLGLWIVRSSLIEMWGTIECQSELGRGATFLIRLPIMPSATTA